MGKFLWGPKCVFGCAKHFCESGTPWRLLIWRKESTSSETRNPYCWSTESRICYHLQDGQKAYTLWEISSVFTKHMPKNWDDFVAFPPRKQPFGMDILKKTSMSRIISGMTWIFRQNVRGWLGHLGTHGCRSLRGLSSDGGSRWILGGLKKGFQMWVTQLQSNRRWLQIRGAT